MNGAKLVRLGRRDVLAAQHEPERCLSADKAGKPLRAASAGQKPDPRFGKAELRLVVIGGDTVMAGERQFEGAAETGAVDRTNDGLSRSFEAAAEAREPRRLGQEIALFFIARAVLTRRIGRQHGNIGTARE